MPRYLICSKTTSSLNVNGFFVCIRLDAPDKMQFRFGKNVLNKVIHLFPELPWKKLPNFMVFGIKVPLSCLFVKHIRNNNVSRTFYHILYLLSKKVFVLFFETKYHIVDISWCMSYNETGRRQVEIRWRKFLVFLMIISYIGYERRFVWWCDRRPFIE